MEQITKLEEGARVQGYCIFTSKYVKGTLRLDGSEWVVDYDDGHTFKVLSREHLFAA